MRFSQSRRYDAVVLDAEGHQAQWQANVDLLQPIDEATHLIDQIAVVDRGERRVRIEVDAGLLQTCEQIKLPFEERWISFRVECKGRTTVPLKATDASVVAVLSYCPELFGAQIAPEVIIAEVVIWP